jgi:hypothetical protein
MDELALRRVFGEIADRVAEGQMRSDPFST